MIGKTGWLPLVGDDVRSRSPFNIARSTNIGPRKQLPGFCQELLTDPSHTG
jgi:hypothetical protein